MRKIFQDLTLQDPARKQSALKELLDTLDFSNATEIASVEDLELQNENLKYSIKRLIRGLASGRDDARMGFSLALTEVLKQLKIKINVLWGFIITLTESKGSTNSKEERDISIGRIFGVMAIVNSGMIKKTGIQLQDFKEIVDFLIKSFHFKVYLRIPAMEVLLSLLEDIKQESIGEEGISYSILKGIKTGNEVEEIWMIIRLQNSLQVKYDWETLLQEWINGDPLERQNLKKLVSVLQDSTILNPDLHPIWEDIFMNLIPQAQKKTIKKRITTLELWTLLEKTLFNSTHERKCLGFGIFNYLLKNLPQEDVVTIFGQNFTRCLMNNLSNKETYLNKVARETAEQISLKAEESKNIALDLLLQLIGPYGSLSFDSISKTKTVDKILNNLSPEQVRGYITHLKGLFMNQGGGQEETVDTRKGPDVVRSRILDQLVALFKIQGIEKDEGWIKEIIKFLVHHGFFSVSNPTQEMEIAVPPISHKTQTYARVKLESVLGFLHSITLNKYTERKYRGLMLDGEPWARYVIDTMDVFKASDAYNSLIEFDESVERIIGKTGKLLKSIRKKKGSLTKENVESTKIINQLNCFESLISHVLIQSYSDPSDLTALIDDFEECFANLWPKESRPKKRKSIESGETNIVPIDVLVDIFLSLLSKPSAPLRALILDIFKVFSSMISEKSLEIIFEVLKSANGPAGSEDIFEEEDDFEQISEVEKMEEDHSSSTEDSEEDSNMEVIEEKVMEEDNGMNDGEMEEYDLKLAAIFKQRSLDQTQKKDMKKHTLHFKLRVIDLLEAFSQSQPQSPFILFLIENILDLILNSGEKELKDRLTNALRKILSRKEHPSSLEVDSKKAEEMLRRVHDLSCRIIDSSFSTLCSLASVFLVKVLSGTKQIESPSAKKQKISSHSSISSDTLVVSQIYLDSFNNFITKSKSKLKPSLFLELFNRYPQYGWEIFPQMVDLLGGEKIKSYNLVQGYNIMATLVKLNKEISSRADIIDAIAPKISSNLIKTLNMSSSIDKGPFQLNKERFRDLMKDLITLIRVGGKICSDHTLDWNNTELLSSINNFIETKNFSDAKWMNNLLKELQILIKP